MLEISQWLARTYVSNVVQRELWLIPMLQTVHILAIAMVLSSIGMIALRIFGIGQSQSMMRTTRRFAGWIWIGLIVLAATGSVLIIGEPKRSLLNIAFGLKMSMLAAAIGLTLAYQLSLRRNAGFWSDDSGSKTIAKVIALCTFVLWCAIAVAGRWIAYMNVS